MDAVDPLPPPGDSSWHEVDLKVPAPGYTEETEIEAVCPMLLKAPVEGGTLAYLAPPGVEAWVWSDEEGWKPALPVGVLTGASRAVGLVSSEPPGGPIGLWLRQDSAERHTRIPGETFEAETVKIEDCGDRVATLAKGFGGAFAFGAPPDTAEAVHRAARANARHATIVNLAIDLGEAWSAVSCPDECPHKRARFLTGVGWRVHMDSAVQVWIGVGLIFFSSVALEAAIEVEFYCVRLV